MNGRDTVAVITEVAHPDRKAVASLHGGGERLTSQCRADHILNIPHADTVAGGCLAINVDIKVVSSGDPFRYYVCRTIDGFQNTFRLDGKIPEHVQIAAEDLDSQIGTHACGEHVDAVNDRLGPAVTHPDLLQPAVQFGNNIGFFDPRPPLFLGFQDDDRFKHGDRCRVGGGFCTADLAQDMLYLGNAFNDRVLHLNDALGLGDRDIGQGNRHVEQRAFVQGRHEFASQLHEHGDGDQQCHQVQDDGGFFPFQHPADHRRI